MVKDTGAWVFFSLIFMVRGKGVRVSGRILWVTAGYIAGVSSRVLVLLS